MTSANPPAIAVTGLRKSYGDNVVLDGIDLAVAEGTIFSLLGPNGAGKTTAVQILSTLIGADGGDVRVAGHDLAADPQAVRASIGASRQRVIRGSASRSSRQLSKACASRTWRRRPRRHSDRGRRSAARARELTAQSLRRIQSRGNLARVRFPPQSRRSRPSTSASAGSSRPCTPGAGPA